MTDHLPPKPSIGDYNEHAARQMRDGIDALGDVAQPIQLTDANTVNESYEDKTLRNPIPRRKTNANTFERKLREGHLDEGYGRRKSADEILGSVSGDAIRDAVSRILNDPIAWGEALGYKGTKNGRKRFGDFHRHLLANAMNNVYSSTMCPRGHGKSTLLSVVYASWCLLRNPEERILIACAGLDLAEKLVGEIRARLSGQLELLPGLFISVADIFPHMRVVGNSATSDSRSMRLVSGASGPCQRFNIAGRSAGLGREPSVFAGSVGSNLAGNHPTMAIVDDPSTEQNCRTFSGRQSVIDFIDQLVPLMYEPGVSKVCHIGTCWANDDVSKILREREDWHQVRYGVYDRAEEGKGLCDSYMTLDEAKQVEDSVRPAFFAAQYLNEPIPDDVPIFTADLLNKAVIPGLTTKELAKPRYKEYGELLLFDPVGRLTGEYGSNNGLVIVRPIPAGVLGISHDKNNNTVAPNRNIFVVTRALEIEEGLESAIEWVEQIMPKDHPNMKAIWIEKLAQQAAIGPWLEERGRIAGIRVLGHRPNGTSSKEGKYMRIQGIQAALRRGLIVFPSDGFPGRANFFQQLRNYPKVDYDDMLMALALLSNMLERKGALPGMPKHKRDPHLAPPSSTAFRRGRRKQDGLW